VKPRTPTARLTARGRSSAIKATEKVSRFTQRQLLNYLGATRLELGLLPHFGPEPKVYRLVDGNKNSTRMTRI
jgi:hypothetical protein